jgi:hypothetical protein
MEMGNGQTLLTNPNRLLHSEKPFGYFGAILLNEACELLGNHSFGLMCFAIPKVRRPDNTTSTVLFDASAAVAVPTGFAACSSSRACAYSQITACS